MLAKPDDCWSDDTVTMLATLLNEYCRHSRLPAKALSKRLIAYTGAWQLMCALQHQSTQDAAAGSDDAQALLAKAEQTFESLEQITANLTEKLI